MTFPHIRLRVFAACMLVLLQSVAAQASGAYGNLPEPIDLTDCDQSLDDWGQRAAERVGQRQLGLPVMVSPADNQPTAEKAILGRKLFFDRRLSINHTMSCAMCHVPEQGFVNRELRTAVGVEGRSVKRNAPTLVNVGFLDVLFHDGRDLALETQFVAPMVARNEMANPSIGLVVGKLNSLEEYKPLFEAAFGGPASLDRIGKAISVYERTLVAGNSPFDRWYYGGESEAVSEEAKKGFELFTGKAGCATCHLVGEDAAIFTDQAFHDTGYGWLQEQKRQNPPDIARVQIAPGVFHDVDFEKIASVSAVREGDIGRYEVTEDPADRWKFRTAPLRNVALTSPYMHDGALGTLREVVEFYNSGGPGHAEQDELIVPLGLGEEEINALLAFLESLTSPGMACLAAEARSEPPDNH